MFDQLLRDQDSSHVAIVGSLVAIAATCAFGCYLTASEGALLEMYKLVLFTTVLMTPVVGPLGWFLGLATARVAVRCSRLVLVLWALLIGVVGATVAVGAFWFYGGWPGSQIMIPALVFSIVVSLAFSSWVAVRARRISRVPGD